MSATRRESDSRSRAARGLAADTPGDIEMATITKKTALLGKDVDKPTPDPATGGTVAKDGAGAATSADAARDASAPSSPTSATRPSTTSGASSPPPECCMPLWARIMIFVALWFLVMGLIRYFKKGGEPAGFDVSKLSGTWKGLNGDVYVVEGKNVKRKTRSGMGYVPDGHLWGRSDRTRLYWDDNHYQGKASPGQRITTDAGFGEDQAKNEVNYISWSTHTFAAQSKSSYDVWIHVEKIEAAKEDMMRALDGTWFGNLDASWTEAKVVRKGNEQVWQEKGKPVSAITWSADGKLLERHVAGGAPLTWDGYVGFTGYDSFQYMTWQKEQKVDEEGEAIFQWSQRWQKAKGSPINTEELKGTWRVRPEEGGEWKLLFADECYGKVSTSGLATGEGVVALRGATWKHDNVAWKADTLETLPGGVRRIRWTSEGKGAMLWQDKVFGAHHTDP